MILSDLYALYERMAAAGDGSIPRTGWAKKGASWCLELDSDGKVVGCVPLMDESEKKPRPVIVPAGQRQSNVKPFFLCDNREYLFGDDVKKGAVKHAATVELHHAVLDGVDDAGARALLRFFDEHSSLEELVDNGLLVEFTQTDPKANVVFGLMGEAGFLHNRPAIQEAWAAYNAASGGESTVCLVTGKVDVPKAGLFPLVTGFPGAQSSGASLVGANNESFRSYGIAQGEIGAISAEAAEKTAAALTFLTKDREHKVTFGNDLVVFWTDSPEPVCQELAALFVAFDQVSNNNSLIAAEDVGKRKAVHNALQRIRKGEAFADIDRNVGVHILGLAPYQARLAIRFYETSTLGELEKHAVQFLDDVSMVDSAPCSLMGYVEQTAPLAKRDAIPSPIIAATMQAYIKGIPFPQALFNQIVERTRVDHGAKNAWDMGRRAAILKACLLRKARRRGDGATERSLTVALNEENANEGYLLGRLFAILEKAQSDAVRGANSTIRDRYMGAAASTPERVFPQLMRLAQHHISKSEYGASIDRKIEGVVAMLGDEGFPKTLSYDDQGMFYIGYYQQKKALYAGGGSKDADDNTTAAGNNE